MIGTLDGLIGQLDTVISDRSGKHRSMFQNVNLSVGDFAQVVECLKLISQCLAEMGRPA